MTLEERVKETQKVSFNMTGTLQIDGLSMDVPTPIKDALWEFAGVLYDYGFEGEFTFNENTRGKDRTARGR